jgi:hypothetical protein
MLKFDEILDSNDLSVESQIIQEKINDELNLIIPNILPRSIFDFDFNIFNSSLHNLFFEKYEPIFKDFEKNLNLFLQSDQINELNYYENIWKNFIWNTNNIYTLIADTFWKNKKNFHSNALRKIKIRAAKARMFSEAQEIIKLENTPKPCTKQINDYRENYRSMVGIPCLQDISGKIFYINIKLIFN